MKPDIINFFQPISFWRGQSASFSGIRTSLNATEFRAWREEGAWVIITDFDDREHRVPASNCHLVFPKVVVDTAVVPLVKVKRSK